MDQFEIKSVVSVISVYRFRDFQRPNHTISGTITGVPALALALVIAAAVLHAGWNLLLKQVEEKYIVTWWSVLVSAGLALPVALGGGMPRAEAWPYLIAS